MAGLIGSGKGRVLLAAVIVALALSACGKKGPPEAPEDEEITFPRTYPSR